MEELKRETKFIDNIAYKNKFQFLIWANDNVICQRYFKINGFNEDAVYTAEFADCMEGIVRSIQEDLESKSRIFMWYTDTTLPVKTNGFMTEEEVEKYGSDFFAVMVDDSITGDVKAPDGKIFHKAYINYPASDNVENDRSTDGEMVFKFSFLIDDVPVYEKIWDGNVYPKFVRNGVDLTNVYASFDNRDMSSLNFGSAIVRHMQMGKINLINDFIRRICETLSNNYIDKYEYTKNMGVYKTNNVIDREKYEKAVEYYGGPIKPIVTGHTDLKEETKKYTYQSNFEAYKQSWKRSVRKKTQEYYDTMYPSARQIDYIERHY